MVLKCLVLFHNICNKCWRDWPVATKNRWRKWQKHLEWTSSHELLKENWGAGVKNQKWKRDPNVTPEKKGNISVTYTGNPQKFFKKWKKRLDLHLQHRFFYSASVEEESENEKEIWICGKCNVKCEVDNNRWIVCNKSDLPFHQLGIS